ncbi:aminopeptidase N [Simiduia curdlanivorans]|uniref:Aminopeptidase N n=1 Tax=Simiduia curdlanivorans TaxID=1492769 RepID=A0ABV8V897_9GAMM|nr:aminopeptidase N [Simiduia curdlanivorans]MDN3639531.1 aminopeptidase N [Simiduia curdlanivorans]
MTASNSEKAQTIYLKDYREPSYWIDQTELDVNIRPNLTRVKARLRIRPNKNLTGELLVLAGEGLTTHSVTWNGQSLEQNDYIIDGDSLTITSPLSEGWLETEVSFNPEENTSLEGLYRSRTMYCTQCEAQGFRKITWYLDRPDVMSVFSTRIEADKAQCPVLLSNGNLLEAGELDAGRHFARWVDPFKKPSYLFALVAGDLACKADAFTTVSGRPVAIEVYVEPKDLDKCDHAIDSLKRAMAWDEARYGLEYDLDRYMIVAVDDFNMGAMENKGLNIFNTSCVLANPKTTTDLGFQRVEAVVAHEYFHNWSGNRVTCRDWFQLSLKEGFTVYRDAQFSADMNSATVKRIEDVNLLRSAQFAEDAGPLAHAVRPESFIEISNFYTLTVYEKGAEIVRMLANLLGAETFRAATDYYFSTYDGQAVTCDDFVAAMEKASGRDFTQFKRWYSQAGTPEVTVSDSYDPDANIYTLSFTQSCRATPETVEKLPFHIPVAMGLLGEAGSLKLQSKDIALSDEADNTHTVLELTEATQHVVFTNVLEKPVPSLFRGFSAPVNVRFNYSEAQLIRLLKLDSDEFNRWSASQELAVIAVTTALQEPPAFTLSPQWLEALRDILEQQMIEPAVLAYMLQVPSVSYLHDRLPQYDVLDIYAAREKVVKALALNLESQLTSFARCFDANVAYKVDAEAVGQRALCNAALLLLAHAQVRSASELALEQFKSANNMTDQLAALKALLLFDEPAISAEALEAFYQQWHHEALVVNQWFSLQAAVESDSALTRLEALTQHPDFQWSNPNKVRALVSVFGNQNVTGFHCASGAGYTWLADVVVKVDKNNPQLAARLVTPLTRWAKYGRRGERMRQELARIAAQPLSKDLFEVTDKALKPD